MNETKTSSRYHWAIVASCFMMMAASIGIMVNCFTPLSLALRSAFGATEAKVQLIYTIAVLMSIFAGAVVGKVMSKFTMRLTMPIYAVVYIVSVFLYSRAQSLTTMYIISIFTGIGASGVAIVPCGVLINNWFQEKKGLATGIALTGSVAGGLILVQVVQRVIDAYSWQTAYVVLAIVAAVLLLPTSLFLVKEYPRDKGLLPLGAKEGESAAQAELRGITLKKYIKTGSFWLLALTVFLIGFANMGLQNNIGFYLGSLGHADAFAANIFSVALLIQIAGKIILGIIYDKKGIKFGSFYGIILYVLTIAVLLFSKNIYMAFVFAALFGLVSSMTTVTPPYVAATIVGVRDYPIIYGILSLFYGIGAAVGPLVVSGVAGGSVGYTPVWIGLTVLSLILCATTIVSAKKGEGYAQLTD